MPVDISHMMVAPAELATPSQKKTEFFDKVVNTCTTPEPESKEIAEGDLGYDRCLGKYGSRRGTKRSQGVSVKTEF